MWRLPFYNGTCQFDDEGGDDMKKVGRIAMMAPCGIDCGDCGANKVKDNPALMDSLIAVGFKKEGLPCAGCRSLRGNC